MEVDKMIQDAPEMSTEKLLELIENLLNDKKIRVLRKNTISEVKRLHKDYVDENLSLHLLEEFDLITQKKSNLTNSMREEVFHLVSFCLVQMTKGDDVTKEDNGGE